LGLHKQLLQVAPSAQGTIVPLVSAGKKIDIPLFMGVHRGGKNGACSHLAFQRPRSMTDSSALTMMRSP